VDQQQLVVRARTGDRAAFTALAQRNREMVLGYALALVGDFHVAEDVTQEALFAAYRGLPTLEDPARFPAWLRGIVRFQCGRVRRKRSFDLAPLDVAHDVPAMMLGPEQQLELKEGFHHVLAAIRSLPDAQRELAMLFYIKDYSYREIASFLELPATTVNNRLHAARTALRERLAMSEKRGRVVAVREMVVEAQFTPDETPLILSALRIGDAGQEARLQVVQHAGNGLVRCLAYGERAGISPGTEVFDTGEPLLTPLDAGTITQVMPIFGTVARRSGHQASQDAPARPALLETGIKAIDLLCPFARGGTVGIFGPNGTGRMVISAEVMHSIARDQAGVTIFAFLNGDAESRALHDAPEEEPRTLGASSIVFLPIDNAIDIASPALLAASPLLDARISLSFTQGKTGIWPAVDPLLSTSRLMDPAGISIEHYEAARAVRELLRRQRDLLEGAPDGRLAPYTAEDRLLLSRARKLQRFFSQPFAVAAPFTKRSGQTVALADTIRSCRELLAGAYDDIPEDAFMWRGAIDRRILLNGAG
jgi:RNA polymerase sigma factor (sigma-70 family)